MVEAARESPADFGWYILGLEPKPFHREWQRHFSEHANLILWAPVHHGKSTCLTVLRTIWELGREPDLRILLLSKTEEKAKKWLAQIQANIEHNKKLHDVFPDLLRERRLGYSQSWSSTSAIIQRRQPLGEKEYSVEVGGLYSDIAGSHYDLIVLDDLLDFVNTRTVGERDKSYDWITATVIGRLSPKGGRIWGIGTAQHEQDAYHRLVKESGFFGVKYQAGVAPCLWPEVWSVEKLQAFLAIVQQLEYDRQMLNIPFGEQTGWFPVLAARKCQELCTDPESWWYARPPGDLLFVVAGMDLGASRQKGSALSAIFVAGVDREGLRHALHIRSGLWVGIELFKEFIAVQRAFEPDEWCVESNAAQLHVAEMMADPAIQAAVGATPSECGRISVYALYTTPQLEDTHWGIRAAGGRMQSLQWRIPKGQTEVEHWFADLKRYSPAEHPGDRLKAFHMADARLEGAGEPIIKIASSIVIQR
jgi:hypothetical protein